MELLWNDLSVLRLIHRSTTRKEFTHAYMKYLQVIHAKKREVIHIIHKVIRLPDRADFSDVY